MTFADKIRGHQGCCQMHLIRLRMLACAEPGAALPPQAAAQVREATSTVVAEAEAAGRAVLATLAGSRRHSVAETFLLVRLARLAGAAEEAINAAREGDCSRLCRHLRRFDALATAIWTVERDALA
jgi:hypothetical protein